MGNKIADIRKYIFSHFKATTILLCSFLTLIIVGTFLLCLPISNNFDASPIDHLFTATSATCVTGLVTLTVSEQYTIFGKIVILFLIQFGGLGLMTFISILLLLVKNKLEFKERLLLKDALNKLDFDDLNSYIKDIFKFTFVFETIGACVLSIVFIEQFGLREGIFHSIFLSISAFCNAGIDCLGSTSLINYYNNPIVIITISTLIIFGGIGFSVWFDFKAQIGLLWRFKTSLHKMHSKLKIHTRIVITVTATLLITGSILIFLSEYNGALANMSLYEKIGNAYFSSATLRTAGFTTIDLSIINRFTKFMMSIFMLIGGSPGGTAGGIKTTTFFLLILCVYVQTKKQNTMRYSNRQINPENFISAYTVFFFYILSIASAYAIMIMTEGFDTIDIFFEIVSAIGTVGLSIGITSSLSFVGKLVIIVLMFIGRVGPITIAYTMSKKSNREHGQVKYPKVDVIVG